MTGRPSAFSGHDHDRGDVVAALEWLLALSLDLAAGEDRLHLAADVDQDVVPVDEYHDPIDQLAAAQLGVLALFVLFEQGTHVLGTARSPFQSSGLLPVSSGLFAYAPRGQGRPLLFRSTQPPTIEFSEEYTGRTPYAS